MKEIDYINVTNLERIKSAIKSLSDLTAVDPVEDTQRRGMIERLKLWQDATERAIEIDG